MHVCRVFSLFFLLLFKIHLYLQDKACEDVDETAEGSSSDYETDEEWEVERKKQAAIMEKDKVEMFLCFFSPC